jgi:hypothetical protein
VAFLILTLLTVTARRMTERAAAPPLMAAAHTIGVVRDDGGLWLSLAVPRGPYFRDELLPVTLALANASDRPIPFSGTYLLGACQLSPLDVTMASGGQYLDPVAIGFAPHCPAFPRGPCPVLAAGKSLRVRLLLGLRAGGRLTLTGRAFFPSNARVVSPGWPAPGGRWDVLRRIFPGLFRSSHAPFASGWPSLTL